MSFRRPVRISQLTPVVLLAALLACAGKPLQVEEIPITESPGEQIERLASQLDQARSEKVQVLSPTWFARAESSLEEARSLRKQGQAVDRILRHIAEGRAELAEARSFAKVAATTMPETIEARDAARAAGAPSLGAEYAAIEEEFLALTRGIEEEELTRAQRERDALTQSYRALELKAIKEKTLAAVRARIDEAMRRGAATAAPAALALANQKLRETEKFIADHRYAAEQMNERAQEALFYANRCLQITAFVNEASKKTQEQRAIEWEAFFAQLAEELGAGDLRDQSLEQQGDLIRAKVAALRKDRDFLVSQAELFRSESERLSTELAVERGTTEALERERQFNQLYAQVSSYFEPGEAEVYKQGNRLLIRLRGLQFPVGQHIIQPEDYPLLTKVQMAIRLFGDPNVIIEGHTDTTGSSTLNQHLSEERAGVVQAYLLANNVLPADQLTAIGKGFSDPLAPNTTEEGRALNRRIDVIIEPRLTPPAVAAGAATN